VFGKDVKKTGPQKDVCVLTEFLVKQRKRGRGEINNLIKTFRNKNACQKRKEEITR